MITLYIDPANGKTTGECSDINEPCTLEHAFTLPKARRGGNILIRVRRAGGRVVLAAPTAALDKFPQFGVYVQGNTTPVEGTIEFTGTFTIAAEGQVWLAPNTSVQFEDVTLNAGDRTTPFFLIGDKSEERIVITGTLTIPDGESVRLPALVVSRNFTLKGGTKGRKDERAQSGRSGIRRGQSNRQLIESPSRGYPSCRRSGSGSLC